MLTMCTPVKHDIYSKSCGFLKCFLMYFHYFFFVVAHFLISQYDTILSTELLTPSLRMLSSVSCLPLTPDLIAFSNLIDASFKAKVIVSNSLLSICLLILLASLLYSAQEHEWRQQDFLHYFPTRSIMIHF